MRPPGCMARCARRDVYHRSHLIGAFVSFMCPSQNSFLRGAVSGSDNRLRRPLHCRAPWAGTLCTLRVPSSAPAGCAFVGQMIGLARRGRPAFCADEAAIHSPLSFQYLIRACFPRPPLRAVACLPAETNSLPSMYCSAECRYAPTEDAVNGFMKRRLL